MVRALLAALLLASVVSAGDKPTPPLDLPAPPEPSRDLEGRDLSTFDGGTLRGNAFDAYELKDWPTAIQLQYWGVQKDGEGRYNLACFYAVAGRIDGALYWLQQCALEEGVDVEYARQDPDLAAVRKDERWAKLEAYFAEALRWWGESGKRETLLVLPAGYQKGTPIGALIGLHGAGSGPDDFGNADEYQELSTRLNLAFVGVSGTRPTSPTSYLWAEDPAADAARVLKALEEVADRVTIAPGKATLIGFSQGAQVALEVAARHPDKFAGAIAISPGAKGGAKLAELQPADALKPVGFVVLVGAGEEAPTVQLASTDKTELERLGARVLHRETPGQEEHALPPDFVDKLGEWYAFTVDRK